MTAINPKSAESVFDSVGEAYEDAFANNAPQDASITWLKEQLASKKPARCLDIGCGTGRPVCSELAAAGHSVKGTDVSGVMVEAARRNVPNATFEKADVKDYNPGLASYDAITVYFSMISSFTQDEIRESIKKVFTWLKPGGVFVFATVTVSGNNMDIKWMGRPMLASSLSAEEAISCIKEVGFQVEYDEVNNFMPRAVGCEEKDVQEEPHLFVYARKH